MAAQLLTGAAILWRICCLIACMNAISQTMAHPTGNNVSAFPPERRTIARHLIGWVVAWWFFAKVLPIFENVYLGLGFAVSSLGSLLVGLSHYSTLSGLWLVPLCLVTDCAVIVALQRMGRKSWQHRWTLAVEVFLFAGVALVMLVFLPPIVAMWVASLS